MHIKKTPGKNTLSLAIALALVSGMGSSQLAVAAAGDICENDGSDACDPISGTLATDGEDINFENTGSIVNADDVDANTLSVDDGVVSVVAGGGSESFLAASDNTATDDIGVIEIHENEARLQVFDNVVDEGSNLLMDKDSAHLTVDNGFLGPTTQGLFIEDTGSEITTTITGGSGSSSVSTEDAGVIATTDGAGEIVFTTAGGTILMNAAGDIDLNGNSIIGFDAPETVSGKFLDIGDGTDAVVTADGTDINLMVTNGTATKGLSIQPGGADEVVTTLTGGTASTEIIMDDDVSITASTGAVTIDADTTVDITTDTGAITIDADTTVSISGNDDVSLTSADGSATVEADSGSAASLVSGTTSVAVDGSDAILTTSGGTATLNTAGDFLASGDVITPGTVKGGVLTTTGNGTTIDDINGVVTNQLTATDADVTGTLTVEDLVVNGTVTLGDVMVGNISGTEATFDTFTGGAFNGDALAITGADTSLTVDDTTVAASAGSGGDHTNLDMSESAASLTMTLGGNTKGLTITDNGGGEIKTTLNGGTGTAFIDLVDAETRIQNTIGKITLETDVGSVDVVAGDDFTVTATDAVTITAGTGAASVSGATASLSSTVGAATVTGAVDAGVIATTGTAALTALSGDATVSATGGAATVSATGGDASLISTDMAAIVTGDTGATVTATTGTAALTADAGAATVSATGGDASLISTDMAAIVTGDTGATVTATTGTAALTADAGAATVSATGGDATLISTDMDAFVTGVEATMSSSATDGGIVNVSATNASVTLVGANGSTAHGLIVGDEITTLTGGSSSPILTLEDVNAELLNDAGHVTLKTTGGGDKDIRLDSTDDVTVIAADNVDVLGDNVDITARDGYNASLNTDDGNSINANSDGSVRMTSTSNARVEGTGTTAQMWSGNSTGNVAARNDQTHATYNGYGLVTNGANTYLDGSTMTTMTGNVTNLRLDASGAHLDNHLDMGGNQINNLADGYSDFDAVNKRQLDEVDDRAKEGIAAVAAMASIPGPIPGKRYSIGVGVGGYESETALAIGGNFQVTDQIIVKASAGVSDSETVGGLGASFSW